MLDFTANFAVTLIKLKCKTHLGSDDSSWKSVAAADGLLLSVF